MNSNAKVSRATGILSKADSSTPALTLIDRDTLAIRAGTVFVGRSFPEQMTVTLPQLVPGADYGVAVTSGSISVVRLDAPPLGDLHLGGFHFAPGGNAPARAGGDAIPAINPRSLWDQNYRFAGDPRGMALVTPGGRKTWADIYMLGKDHLINGTSKFGVTIADGDDPPQNPTGGYFDGLDYATAAAVYQHHGKTLFSVVDLLEIGYGVTEKTAAGRDPRITGLDAPRTSKDGLHQMTGNLWQWCHDGDPDMPRASIFGGSWWDDGDAGSRHAYVAYDWPGDSFVHFGARGRGDHLQLD